MNKKLFALLMLFFISFGLFAFVTVFNKPITQLTRAKEDSVPSAERSRMIVWPLNVKSDGTTGATITVFVVSESDKPLPNKVVTVSNTLGQFKETAVTSDSSGKSVFTLTSQTPGIAEIEVMIEPNIKLAKKISVKFE